MYLRRHVEEADASNVKDGMAVCWMEKVSDKQYLQ
jgi:hypothetical protein